VATRPTYERLRIDARDIDAAGRAAWSALADRAVEPNPFFRPEFALANMAERGVPLELLVVRDGATWLACLPVRRRPPTSRLPVRTLDVMTDEYSFLGTLLLDRDHRDAAAEAFLDLVEEERRAAVVVLREWAPDGPVAIAIRGAAERRGLRPIVNSAFERAAWHRAPEGPSLGANLPGDDQRHLRKRTRRLTADLGEPQIVNRTSEPAAWEAFLQLENTGWKADRGNPMVATPGDAAFFRRVCAEMSATGVFELLSLEAGGKTLALETHLIDGDALYSFKIAHDPEYRAYAPGTQLKARVIDGFHDRGLRLADSCASQFNEHMNRLWPDRRPLETLLLPTGAVSARLLRPMLGVRDVAKRVGEGIRGRRPEGAVDASGVR
jgi:CelD/BcsL family acetyltransferase involved in cellulose biosynthesis